MAVGETGKVLHSDSELEMRQGEARDSRVLKDIANEMEADFHSRNPDKKVSILDTKIRMSDGLIVFQRYEKPVSSKEVLNIKSAQSMACKKKACMSRRSLEECLTLHPNLTGRNMVLHVKQST